MSADQRRVTDHPGMRRFADDDVVDVVVVGTGAGGAPLLARLAEAGLRVVALEAGPDFAPSEFTPDELESTKINWMSERLSGGDDRTAFGRTTAGSASAAARCTGARSPPVPTHAMCACAPTPVRAGTGRSITPN